jgi:hypothetical protein
MTGISDPASLINQLPVSLEMPKDFEQFREISSLLFKRIIDAVNKKEGSLYYLQEIGNFESFFTSGQPYVFRTGYRYVFDLVALNGGNIAGGATVIFPHGIIGFKIGTLIYATATATTGISFTVTYSYCSMDATNIYFTNPLPGTALSSVIFVGEYLKN